MPGLQINNMPTLQSYIQGIDIHWNAVWALSLYLIRIAFDILIIGYNKGSLFILERLRRIGPDLFWIGFVIWGVLLATINPSKTVSHYFGSVYSIRLWLVALIFLCSILMCWYDIIYGNINRENIQSLSRVLMRSALVIIIHLIGLTCFWTALVFME